MKTTPFKCPVCCSEPDNFYGRLVFEEEDLPVFCPNHKVRDPETGEITEPFRVELVPSTSLVDPKQDRV